MAFTRPAKSVEISAEDFGQPVYDWITAATPGVWAGVAFISGDWINYPTYQACQYRKTGLAVNLRGVAQRKNSNLSAGWGSDMFTLPVGFRPSGTLIAPSLVGYADVGSGRLDIQNWGVVKITPAVTVPIDGFVGFALSFWTD